MTPESWTLQLTEDALAELITTHARHTAASGDPRPERFRQRHLVTAGLMGGRATAERAACWLRMVSIVEIYGEALLRHLDGDSPGRTPGSWSDVAKFLKQRHDIDVHDLAGWDSLETCFLVRNAVAHGLGRFTAKQIEKAVPQTVRGIGVPVRDGMAMITVASLDACAETCRTFISDLDAHPRVIVVPLRSDRDTAH